MKTLFTVHAGEFLVGSKIEEQIKGINIWLPAKDKGIDLLVTNSQNSRSVSLQVKFSRDFLVTHMESMFQEGLLTCGWWTHSRKKIRVSKADLWVFVLQAFDPQKTQFILIPPQELDRRLSRIHGTKDRVQSYLWVTKRLKCWETRDLPKRDQILIANNAYVSEERDFNEERDFTQYLNAWKNLEHRLKK